MMNRDDVIKHIRAGGAVAWLSHRGAIATCAAGGFDLIALASREYFRHKNDARLFIDGCSGLSCTTSSDGDEELDQYLNDRMWEEVPEPERDPQIEKLADEIFAHTPMQRQVLREMATKLVCSEVLISIASKMPEKLWGIN